MVRRQQLPHHPIRAVALLSLLAATSIANAQNIPVFSPTEVAAVTAEQNAAGVNGTPVSIDPASPTGQAFIQAMFTGTPFNATNTPMLFRALKAAKLPPPSVKTTVQLGAMQDGQVSDLIDIVDVSNDGAGNVTASGLVSTVGGAQFVHASLVLVDSQTKEPLGPISYTSDPQGKLVTLNASGKLKPGGKAIAVLFATITPTACAPSAVGCQSRLGSDGKPVAGLPAHLSASTYAQAAFVDVGVSPKRRPVVLAPVKTRDPSTGNTVVCLGRSPTGKPQADCDYADVTTQGPSIYPVLRMPVAGSVDLNAPAANPLKVSLFKMYVVPATGGACSTYDTKAGPSMLTAINNGSTIQWNLGLKSTQQPAVPGDPGTWAQFGQLSGNQYACWTNVGGPILFSLQFKVVDVNGAEVIAQVNDFGQSNANTTAITPISLAYGCVAENTLVKMADGSSKPIEQVEVGDLIIADGAGSVRRVSKTYLGYEALPLVQIKTPSGLLKLTEGHPVVLADGKVVAAKDVKKGQRLRDGANKASAVLAVDRLASKKPVRVRNLSVEPVEAGAAPLTDAQHTFVAAGLVIGDNTLQERLHQPPAARSLASAPPPAVPGWEKEARLAHKLRAERQKSAGSK